MSLVPSSAARSVAALIFLASSVALHAADKPDVTIFAPGPIPTSATSILAPAFTPDGKTVYIGQQTSSTAKIVIVSSHLTNNQWSAPVLAPFSDQYRDLEPAFAPNGRYLIFASSRPTTPGGTELEGHYNGQVLPGKGGNLWKVARTKRGWGTPERLPSNINANTSVFSPAVAADGSLYFMRCDDGKGFHIFRSQWKDGQFETPVPVSFTDPAYSDYDPAVAPDESFIIFSSGRPPAPKVTDLFLAFRTATGWSDPIDLRSALSDDVHGIEARLSPDGKTLYFANSREAGGAVNPDTRSTWKVDISGILQAHHAGIDLPRTKTEPVAANGQ
jgi:Tol biopolymer transport system component